MWILGIDAAAWACSVAVLGPHARVERRAPGDRSQGEVLPSLVSEVLAACGIRATEIGLIGVTVGPGSFTGLRAALALARGMALVNACPVVAVSVGEAFAQALDHALDGRILWCVTDTRRGSVYLERTETLQIVRLNALPETRGARVALAGNAAALATAMLAARNADVMLTAAREPSAAAVAEVARRRNDGLLPPRAVQPIYLDDTTPYLQTP